MWITKFIGRMDLVDDKIRIRDTKTSARTPTQDQVDTDLQMTAYSMGYRVKTGEDRERTLDGLHRQKQRAESGERCHALRDFPPFPEPFLLQSRRGSEKWRRDYLELITRQDLRDLTRVREIEGVQQLVWLLPERGRDLPCLMLDLGRLIESAHTTVKSWLEELRKLYVVFPPAPLVASHRAGIAPGAEMVSYRSFHNCRMPVCASKTSSHAIFTARLLPGRTWVWETIRCFYLRTLDKTEIDFVLTCNNRPWLCVECKLSDTKPASSLVRRKDILGIPTLGIQVVETTGIFSRPEAGLWWFRRPFSSASSLRYLRKIRCSYWQSNVDAASRRCHRKCE